MFLRATAALELYGGEDDEQREMCCSLLFKKHSPKGSHDTQSHPKHGPLSLVNGGTIGARLKLPHTRTIFQYLVPPTQSNQESPSDILRHPEIGSLHKNDHNESDDEYVLDLVEYQIENQIDCQSNP